MLDSLKKYFKEHAERHEEKKNFKVTKNALMQSIGKKDEQAVSALFNEIKDSPFLQPVYDEILRAAIDTDNTTIFSTIMQNRKPNYWFISNDDTGPGGPHFSEKEHILHAVIEAGSKSIALMLAKNPEVFIDKSGQYTETDYHEGGFFSSGHTERQETVYPAPLELAEEKNMYEVAAVLAKRTSKGYNAEAQKAKAKAAHTP